MTKGPGILWLLLALYGCATPPAIAPPAPGERAALEARCRGIFLSRPWQLSHGIHYTAPGGRAGAMIGVVRIDPESGSVACNLLAPEGLLLVDAEACGEKVLVRRAIRPFDEPDFLRGLLDDIRLVFLAPASPAHEAGFSADGALRCRYPSAGGGRVEAALLPDGGWEILRYDGLNRIARQVQAPATPPGSMPVRMSLAAPGALGYRMEFTLLGAEPVPPAPDTGDCQGPLP